jgi:hypothetical protein
MYPRTDNRKAGCGYFPAVPPPTRVITRPFALANYYDYLDGAGPMVFRPQGTPALKDAVSATPFSPLTLYDFDGGIDAYLRRLSSDLRSRAAIRLWR